MKLVICILFSIVAYGCSSIMLKDGNFAWPVESELKVDNRGFITDDRNNISINVKELLFAETKDSVKVENITIRIIRNIDGYYFVTSPKFQNVYVFEQTKGALKLNNKISIGRTLVAPALNQRPPFIQLIDGTNTPIMLTEKGIEEGAKK